MAGIESEACVWVHSTKLVLKNEWAQVRSGRRTELAGETGPFIEERI